STVVLFRAPNQQATPNDYTDNGRGWSRLGVFRATGTSFTVTLNGTSALNTIADAVELIPVIGDAGVDDNFTVQTNSPTIDAGNPASPFSGETVTNNGGRVNLGHTGNTAAAAAS